MILFRNFFAYNALAMALISFSIPRGISQDGPICSWDHSTLLPGACPEDLRPIPLIAEFCKLDGAELNRTKIMSLNKAQLQRAIAELGAIQSEVDESCPSKNFLLALNILTAHSNSLIPPDLKITSLPDSPVLEGDSFTFFVHLTKEPSDDVIVSLTSGGIGLDSLTFNALSWNELQKVTLTAEDNDDIESSNPYNFLISLQASGGGYNGVHRDVPVSVSNDDVGALEISKSLFYVDEGETFTFRVRLAKRPNATVTVRLTSQHDHVRTLRFDTSSWSRQAWDTWRDVTVTAWDDATHSSSSRSLPIELRARGGGYRNVHATIHVDVSDNDTSPCSEQTNPEAYCIKCKGGDFYGCGGGGHRDGIVYSCLRKGTRSRIFQAIHPVRDVNYRYAWMSRPCDARGYKSTKSPSDFSCHCP